MNLNDMKALVAKMQPGDLLNISGTFGGTRRPHPVEITENGSLVTDDDGLIDVAAIARAGIRRAKAKSVEVDDDGEAEIAAYEAGQD